MATLNEEALKRYIAKLPNLDDEADAIGLGPEEIAYVQGVIDAHRVLTGLEPIGDVVHSGSESSLLRLTETHRTGS